jgi:hypothetical protein
MRYQAAMGEASEDDVASWKKSTGCADSRLQGVG